MFLPSKNSFSLVRKSAEGSQRRLTGGSTFRVGYSVFLPNSQSFYLSSSPILKPVIQSGVSKPTVNLPSSLSSDSGERIINIFLPNSQSFYLSSSPTLKPAIQSGTQGPEVILPSALSSDTGEPIISDKNKRQFLKVAGVAGVSLGASLLFPKKAQALIMGSSPTTGVVGVKNAANTRINPATEETLDEVLKTSDLTFDAGSLQVKVTSIPDSSFSDSGNVAKKGLVDADRHVQVDVLSSALPSTASTETTLQTISFGGFKFTLRLDTVGDIDYIGEASIGTATSAASWRIKRINSATGIIVQWAGTGVFDQIWDNRAALSYS